MIDIDYKLLKALFVVVQEGGFEKAARVLHISQPAVSRRVKQLEEQTGQVLLTRTTPPLPTRFGRHMIKHYQQVRLLEADLFETVDESPEKEFVVFPIGVNVDSLSTWFLDAMGAFLKEERVLLDLIVENQEYTHRLMQTGEVGGCISSRPAPMQGCRVDYLGSTNYHLLATPQFAAQWFPDGVTYGAACKAPFLVFNRKDNSHEIVLESILGRVPEKMMLHYFPATERFADFIAQGLACGMCDITADENCMQMLEQGVLMDLAPDNFVTVKLYWHMWNLHSKLLARFSRKLVSKARKILLP
nr:LysR family transcriptional regulator ArgP [uncultured Desulfobacter sp.]